MAKRRKKKDNVFLEDKEGREYDPVWEEAVEQLHGMKEYAEKLASFKTKEEREAYHEKMMSRPPPFPNNYLERNCPPTSNDAITEMFLHLFDFGTGDFADLCELSVFREALERIDLDECMRIRGGYVNDVPLFLNRCLVHNIEKVVQERLIEDGENEKDARETHLWTHKQDYKRPWSQPFSPWTSTEWDGPLDEKAKRKYHEKE